MSAHQLYFSADEIRAALNELGPTGDRAEATVAIAAGILADLIERPPDPEFIEGGECVGWRVDHYLDPASARQAGRPHVLITSVDLDEGGEE